MILRGFIYVGRRVKWFFGGIWGRAVLRSYGVGFGPGLRLGSAPIVRRVKGAEISIGRNVVILNELAENPAGIAHRTVLCACQPGARLRIGDGVGISGAVLYAWKAIDIGNRVAIGAGAKVYDTDFHPIDPVERWKNNWSEVRVAPVVIEDDVWLGAQSIVLKGVTIGRESVVAAGAVVTSNVPPGSIVAGVPARVIGQVRKTEATGKPA